MQNNIINILSWAVWACGILVLANQFPFAYFSKDGGIRILAKRYSMLIIFGLLITAFTDISKFHLLWWIPAAYYINFWIFGATAFCRMKKYIDSKRPEVGLGIKWNDIIGEVFLILEFDRNGTIINKNNKVIARTKTMPYGHLLVQSPIHDQPIRLPIVHRDDYSLAASVFDEPKFLDALNQSDLLVTYVPKYNFPKGNTGISHVLHYVITPKGTFDKYCETLSLYGKNSINLESIFIKFVWDDYLSVKINTDPTFLI